MLSQLESGLVPKNRVGASVAAGAGSCYHDYKVNSRGKIDVGRTILTIDDDRTMRALFSMILTKEGFRVLEAPDGRTGLDLVQAEHPDLVICDLRMPGMDGLDVLSTIHQQKPDLPVIVVSGADSISDAVEALKRGAWDYLTKPISDAMLLRSAVARGIEQSRLVRENKEHQVHLEELNAELGDALEQLRTDQEAGRRLQSQLLPAREQTFGHYHFSHRLYPSLFLSGDFIDYFSITPGLVGFYMADVSGHGAASAFVTVMLKTLMGHYREVHAQQADPTLLDPAATLTRIDEDLKRLHLDHHLTMFYGLLDCRSDRLHYSNGGHYPYPLLTAGPVSTVLEMPSCAIGLLPEPVYRSETAPFPKGAQLLLVSDGVLELLPQESLRDKNAEIGRICAEPGVNMDRLVEQFGAEGDVKRLDDVAILLVERKN
jgi:sigma-B regulation protein RsbU (phosphoserine phosphatase)